MGLFVADENGKESAEVDLTVKRVVLRPVVCGDEPVAHKARILDRLNFEDSDGR